MCVYHICFTFVSNSNGISLTLSHSFLSFKLATGDPFKLYVSSIRTRKQAHDNQNGNSKKSDVLKVLILNIFQVVVLQTQKYLVMVILKTWQRMPKSSSVHLMVSFYLMGRQRYLFHLLINWYTFTREASVVNMRCHKRRRMHTTWQCLCSMSFLI